MRVILLCFTLFFLCMLTVSADQLKKVHLNLTNDEIAFTFFDLSDGEATLVQSSEQNVLINTGSAASRNELFKRLQMYGVEDIHQLIVTNSGKAYTENIAAVLDAYDVKNVTSSNDVVHQLTEQYQLPDKMINVWDTGEQTDIIPGIHTYVLHVNERNDGHAFSSLSVKFEYKDHNILYMGLADAAAERQLFENHDLHCKILKVGEFGIENGTIPSFLEKVDPEVAIFFNKKELKAKDLMVERLEEAWVDVYEVNKTGTVSIKLDPYSYDVITIPTG